MVAAVVLTTGCATDVSPTTSPQEPSAPTQGLEAPLNPAAPKEIGELGGIGCDDTDARACDLEFAVTDIEPGFQCPGVGVAPGTQLVRFTVAATTRGVFTYPERLIGGILEARNWGVVDQDGVFADRPEFADCAETDWGLAGLGPGRQEQGTAVLVAPIGARALRLEAAQAGAAGWEWQIPSR
ncbi:hypothetical protein [Tomitella biformata]|uniref:hypothetical protein n=1 Tax=Tomitella biformata TaxID=630403 RepID=UPI0004AE98EB|nr:hypothetical protein [Tomitella biformata]